MIDQEAKWKRDQRAKEVLAARYAACGLTDDAKRLRNHMPMHASDIVAIETALILAEEAARDERERCAEMEKE